jgi:integrase
MQPNGSRETIRLGKIGLEAGRTFKTKVEDLLSCAITNTAPDVQTSAWLAGLPDEIHAKLTGVGLVAPRIPPLTAPPLSVWLDRYLDQRPDLKPSSRKRIEQTVKLLKEHFGGVTRIDAITPDGTADWRAKLAGSGISEATVRLHCRNAKAIFNAAVERELIERNPFRKLTSSAVAAVRDRYVTPDEAGRIVEACPNVAWRSLFGLARFAGLRTPSETHTLTWADVDWERHRLNVRSVKTERYAGHERRTVPITPKLMQVLQDAFDAAPEGQQSVVALSRNNLRRGMRAIVKRAGMEAWSDVFQTLRRSCATEWKQSYPAYAVDAWLGHSARVSEKYYLMIPEDLWDRVGSAPSTVPERGAAESAAQSAAAGTRTELQPAEVPTSDSSDNAEKQGISCDSEHWAEAELNRRHTDFQHTVGFQLHNLESPINGKFGPCQRLIQALSSPSDKNVEKGFRADGQARQTTAGWATLSQGQSPVVSSLRREREVLWPVRREPGRCACQSYRRTGMASPRGGSNHPDVDPRTLSRGCKTRACRDARLVRC